MEAWANTEAAPAAGYVPGIYCPTAAASTYHDLLPSAPIWVTHYYLPSSVAYVPNNTTIFPAYDHLNKKKKKKKKNMNRERQGVMPIHLLSR